MTRKNVRIHTKGYATTNTGSSSILGSSLIMFPLLTAGLGIWQVYRLQWKLNLIEKTQQTLAEDALLIEKPIAPQDVKDMEYRKVAMTGRFKHGDEMIVGPRSRGEGDVGFFVYTPFQRTDASQQTVIVNRGFVPREFKDRKARGDSDPSPEVTIHGIVKESETAPFGGSMTQNNPEANSWGWVELASMAAWTGSDAVLIDQIAGGSPVREWPCPREPRIDYRNQHMQYALTWFSLSAISTYMLFFGRRVGFRGKKVPLPGR